jgi:Arylsulfotransferase (ASST)
MITAVWLVLACTGFPAGSSSGGTTSSGTLDLACVETPNLLRFECLVTVDPPQGVTLVAERITGGGLVPTFTSSAAATEHLVDVTLLAPESRYDLTAAGLGDGNLVAATVLETKALPVGLQSSLTIEGEATVPLIGTDNPCLRDDVAVVYDTRTGEVVWYRPMDADGSLSLENMVRFGADERIVGETGGKLVEVDRTGEEIGALVEGIDYQGYLHHDHYEWGDRIYALSKDVDRPGTDLQLDSVLVLDRRTGGELARWNSWETWEVPAGATGNYFHANSIVVDGAGDVYLSLRDPGAIVKLDGDVSSASFGEPLWILNGQPNSPLTGTVALDWADLPAPAGFALQHNASLRADGRLQVLDNEHGRVLILALDEAASVATAEGAYSTGRPTCVEGQGTAQEGPLGTVFAACSTGPVLEYELDAADPRWVGTPSCVNGLSPVAARFYPLDWRL